MNLIWWERQRKTRRQLKRWLKWANFYLTWTLAIFLMIFLVATAWALRVNNLGMLQRRQAVVLADQSGTTTQLEAAVDELQRYVGRHMNTYMGEQGMTLQHSYDTAVKAAVQKSLDQQKLDISPEVYAQYDAVCAPRLASGEWSYRNCISSQIDYQGKNWDFSAPNLPDPALYYVNFAPPHLSLDWAGALLVIDLTLIVVILARAIFNLAIRGIIRLEKQKTQKMLDRG